MAQISDRLTFLIENLNLPEAVGDEEAGWETFQLQHINNPSIMSIDLKSRQVGWSWNSAADAVGDACTRKRSTSIFVSINQEEAAEKIRYAKQIMEALDPGVKPRLVIDNRFELEFENGSRLVSHPCRPVRGKARARVYLDEFAHYPNDREIYQSAVPVVSKGGVLRIGSSPFGAQGLFWDIYTQNSKQYPGYRRRAIPWWTIRAFCKNVKRASIEAPGMSTHDRVMKFARRRMVDIYENMVLDDYQQEYECAWVDEAVSWIDWAMIKKNQSTDAEGRLVYRTVSGTDAALRAVDELAEEIVRGTVEDVLTGGMDIGRRHDTTEIILVGKQRFSGQTPYRLGITLDRVPFDMQEMVLYRIMDALPVLYMLIDQTGIGMQLAERAHVKYGVRAQGMDFTNASKSLMAVETRLRFERGNAPIPIDRELSRQIHSIRKKITAAKNIVFDVTANDHHADKFWALALAYWAGRDETAEYGAGDNPLGDYRG